MRVSGSSIVPLLLGFALAFPAAKASDTASALVTFSVLPISIINISSNPPPMIIDTLPPPGQAAVCRVTSAHFDLTTNMTSQRILGCLDAEMPPGLTLRIKMEPPQGATSVGSMDMSCDDVALLTGISNVAQKNLEVRYTLRATIQAYGQGPVTRVVTYTIAP